MNATAEGLHAVMSMYGIEYRDLGLMPTKDSAEGDVYDAYCDYFTAKCGECGAEFCATSKIRADDPILRASPNPAQSRVNEMVAYVEAMQQQVIAHRAEHAKAPGTDANGSPVDS